VLIEEPERDALRIARLRLRYRVIEPERPQVKRRFGVCYRDGTIHPPFMRRRVGRSALELVDTLCYELAHLRHFNHGKRFNPSTGASRACAGRDLSAAATNSGAIPVGATGAGPTWPPHVPPHSLGPEQLAPSSSGLDLMGASPRDAQPASACLS
jgi:hypothetical protein